MTGNQLPVDGTLPSSEKIIAPIPLTVGEQLDKYLNPDTTNLGHTVLTNQEVSIGWMRPGEARGLATHAKTMVYDSGGQINENKVSELDTNWAVAPAGKGVVDAIRLKQFEANPEKDDTDPRSLAMRNQLAMSFLKDGLADSQSVTDMYGWESLPKRPREVYGLQSLPGIMENTQPNQPNRAQKLEKEIYYLLGLLPHSPYDLNGSADKLRAIFAHATVEARAITEQYNIDNPSEPKDPIDAVVGVHRIIISAIKAFDGKDKTLQRYLETAIGFQAMREELNKP